MIRIYSKDALKVSLEEEKACNKLVTSGSIYTLYVECCNIKKRVKHRIFIVKDSGKCVGWSVIKKRKKNKTPRFEFMVYIKRKYRRRGIGTKLYNRSKKYFELPDKDIRVYATTNYNSIFFDKIRRV